MLMEVDGNKDDTILQKIYNMFIRKIGNKLINSMSTFPILSGNLNKFVKISSLDIFISLSI